MSTDQITFGIVGCGVIADFHARALSQIKNARLLGACDKNNESTARFAQKYAIHPYPSYEDMLADPAVDAVCICTPSAFHAENAVAALSAGKHVAVEKPMAFTKAEAARIAESVQKSGRLLTSIAQLRFADDIIRTKQLIDDGALGQLTLCDLYMKYWRSEEYYAQSDWRGTLQFDGGGALMNQGIHGVDALLYLAGGAKVLSSVNKTAYHRIEAEDISLSLLAFENGACGVIEAATCAYPGFERRLELIGTKGCVILKEDQIEKLVLDGKTLIDGIERPTVGTASDPTAMNEELHRRQLQNLVNAIQGTEPLVIDVQEGAKAVALIEEIYKKDELC